MKETLFIRHLFIAILAHFFYRINLLNIARDHLFNILVNFRTVFLVENEGQNLIYIISLNSLNTGKCNYSVYTVSFFRDATTHETFFPDILKRSLQIFEKIFENFFFSTAHIVMTMK